MASIDVKAEDGEEAVPPPPETVHFPRRAQRKLSTKCEACDKEADDGWTVRSVYYCADCWHKWNPNLVKPEKAMSSSFCRKRPKTEHDQRDRIQPRRFGFGYGCRCCGDDDWDWDSYYNGEDDDGWNDGNYEDDSGDKSNSTRFQPWFVSQPDPLELRGLGYIDAHLHLDCLLQNRANGGPGWDSKQRLCKYFLSEWGCHLGDSCQFAHGEETREPRVPLKKEEVEDYFKDIASFVRATQDDSKPATHSSLLCMVTSCCELDSIPDTQIICEMADKLCPGSVLVTIGCHPHNYRWYNEAMENRLLQVLETSRKHVIAWGECGLDYYKNYDESLDPVQRERMVEVFARQARLAVERQLPIVVHSRDAPDDTCRVFRECCPRDHKVYIHAFQGTQEAMWRMLELMPNSIFSVSGMAMMSTPNEAVVDVARYCPLDRMVLETDAPYLAMDSRIVPRLAEKVAELKNEVNTTSVTAAEVLKATTENSKRFYNLQDRLS
eukprot:TRINITY_DN11549_c1_g1_i1.p1 TRINITY_DN11549_c1_g1~~TRINITY_DN11549_c1_g1_i1.p1  ORF type:complete len:508 (+),score=60.37 TRINITY_DN11549_c1_g1_i1:45-1526(+)